VEQEQDRQGCGLETQTVPGPGEDPEIGDGQKVDLDEKAPPPGIKKFTTRKPTTAPGR